MIENLERDIPASNFALGRVARAPRGTMTFQLIATLCAALFTGAAIYINPSSTRRMSLGPAVALAGGNRRTAGRR
jgi:hypothetical protein